MHGDRWLTQGMTRMFNVRTLANKVSVPMYFLSWDFISSFKTSKILRKLILLYSEI